MINLKWSPTAAEDLAYWKKNDAKKYRKILALCDSIRMDPKHGLGKPEPLKHELSGCWSRRIDQKNRLVYRFDDDDEMVYILQAGGHY